MVGLLVWVSILWHSIVSSPAYLYLWYNMGSRPGRSTQYVVGCRFYIMTLLLMYLNQCLIVARLCVALAYAFWPCTLGHKVEVIQIPRSFSQSVMERVWSTLL